MNVSAIQREEFLEKAGIIYRYQKLDFAQGVFSRVELLRTQESTENMQDPFKFVCRGQNMSVQAVELSKRNIAQGVKYPKDGLEALHGPNNILPNFNSRLQLGVCGTFVGT